ncbi:inner membrane protein YpjD [Thalassotalea aquiviva]|uniref:cytochrome C assembly family protein n=1 Tax=Thalassotalea aquiviva TaxID=3242415 RepID=UPI00352B9D5D
MVSMLTLLVISLYLLSALAVITRLFHPEGPKPNVYLTLGWLALIGHALLLSGSWFLNADLNFSFNNMLSLMSFVIALVVSTIAVKYKADLILPVVYFVTAILLTLVGLLPSHQHMVIDLNKLSLIVHISSALLAFAILMIATLYAFQVSYINLKLKNKKLLSLSHLPPLMQVEGQFFKILLLGTSCLFLSLLIGFVFIDDFITKENAHKTVLSLVALLVYCSILWGHFSQGWRGKRILTLVIVASFLLTLSYFGSKFVKEFLLS